MRAVCLMGPTASGKTEVALRLADDLSLDLVSVDSALVYRGMDIGTAKPDRDTLRRYPHRLIDIRDAHEPYSAGDFVRDATREMSSITAAGRTPLLVGGTMMYFRALTEGIDDLPEADDAIRGRIDEEAARDGWPALHTRLAAVDPAAADRINPNDSQRIQRALEVYCASGRPLSDWQVGRRSGAPEIEYLKIALVPGSRGELHRRIAARLDRMFDLGLVEEVSSLRRNPSLSADSPSMRAVGYRQVWSHLAGEISLEEARLKALYATRQLAKRQMTWLRSETGLKTFDPLEDGCADAIKAFLEANI